MRKTFVLIALLTAVPAVAQNTDIESLSGLQFSFGNPGARSLGMGGAFLGLADDASAAEANPAGLTILRKPEVTIEARNYQGSQILSTSGSFPDPERTAFSNYSNRIQIAFASVVYPIRNFTLGAYYHEPLRNNGSGFVLPGVDPFTLEEKKPPVFFFPREGGNPLTEQECEALRIRLDDFFACAERGIAPFVTLVDIRQRTFGVAGGWQITKNFSIGGAVRYQTFRESALTVRFDERVTFVQSIAIQATGGLDDSGSVDVETDNDVSFTGGVKWAVTDKFSLGGVYKQGPSFTAPVFVADILATGGDLVLNFDATFHVPDIYGLGAAWRPIPALTLTGDAVRVKYSNLVDDFISIVGDLRNLEGPAFKAADIIETRLGAEYFLATKIPFAIRAGIWRDPAHAIEYIGPINFVEGAAARLLYPEGEDQDHVTLGAGLSWPRFQIDAAYDHSENYKVVSLSMIFRR